MVRKNRLKQLQNDYSAVSQKEQAVVQEMRRVASVLDNIDETIDTLDAEFEQKTGIVNKEDLSFLFVATFLQCTRWLLMPRMDLDFSKIDRSDRLNDNELKQDGPLLGEKSGSRYENEQLNNYTKKYKDKYMGEKEAFDAGDRSGHTSWLEILLRPVPYDAMNANDSSEAGKKLIPNIRDFSTEGVNICGQNHHVATLGHDPFLGWIFGTMNIMSRKISFINLLTYDVILGSDLLNAKKQTIDYASNTNVLDMTQYCFSSLQEDVKRLPAAVARQAMHLESDKLTKNGLPIPLLSAINPELAQKLIKNNWNSNEVERMVKKLSKNAGIVGLQAMLALMINLIIKSIYLLCSDEEIFSEREVRIRKILSVSNVMASSSNLLYVAFTKDAGKLDVGGIGVTLYNLINDKQFIKKLKYEYIANGIENEIKGNKDWEELYNWR